MHASLHHERVSHRPFGAPDQHGAFTTERVGIETGRRTALIHLTNHQYLSQHFYDVLNHAAPQLNTLSR
jgi:hypothetical protein